MALLVPSLAGASFDVSLKYGSRGQAVEELQDFLQDQGFLTGKIDGKFGLGTRKAVIAWQSANNLGADGYFGAISRTRARTVLAEVLKSSDDAEQAETGTITTPVTDPTIKQKIDDLNSQLKQLNSQVQQQTQIQQKIVENTTPAPVVTAPPAPPPAVQPGENTVPPQPDIYFFEGSKGGEISVGPTGGTRNDGIPAVFISGKLSPSILATLEVDSHTYQFEENTQRFNLTHIAYDLTKPWVTDGKCTVRTLTVKYTIHDESNTYLIGSRSSDFCFNNQL